ncbi:MAG: primosomal protein N' [Acidobacteriota bacterium]|nr:primosomal protein N' [Acidobacteriota bacterium]
MPTAAAIAKIEPLTSTRALRGPFDYALPAGLGEPVDVGSLLVVPFGRRELLGVVVGMAGESDLPAERLLEPRDVLSANLPAELVALAQWMAREYCSTPARALSLMLPPGAARGAGPRVVLTAELTAAGRSLLGDGSVQAHRPDIAPPAAGGGRPLGSLQQAALGALAGGPRPVAGLPGGHGTVRRLVARGLVHVERVESERRPVILPVGARSAEALALTAEQARAYEAIARRLDSGVGGRLLLHGVTGSGKTEVYLQAAARALALGLGVIVLVPEIALTPQMVGRFVERLGDTVAVLHSRLSVGERYDEWRRLRSGRARVCVGPRSAVFAPVEKLGLIVVDEEHEASYKHEGDPRYDARRVAGERARMAGALLCEGSATPRSETFHEAEVLRLARRVDGGPLPEVEVLDMRAVSTHLHPRAVEALARVRQEGSKAIVLLNRRGWSAFLSCRGCGHVWGCPECDVSLVMHRERAELSCHHCGFRAAVPERCECGSRSLARHGGGTECLEQELLQILGGEGFGVFRLDGDVAGGVASAAAAGHRAPPSARILHAFEQARCGVLLGTQMVAKGHDFPGVSLGLVLDADAALCFPDFRAEERAFALITQLAGRVGRGGRGRVLVQSAVPEARAISFASAHDSEGFVAGEIERRRALRYPPFADMVRVTCAARDGRAATAAATALRGCLEEELSGPAAAGIHGGPGRRGGARAGDADRATVLLGPAALFRLRGQERRALLLKSTERARAVAALDRAVQRTATDRAHAGVSFSVDVDPH